MTPAWAKGALGDWLGDVGRLLGWILLCVNPNLKVETFRPARIPTKQFVCMESKTVQNERNGGGMKAPSTHALVWEGAPTAARPCRIFRFRFLMKSIWGVD